MSNKLHIFIGLLLTLLLVSVPASAQRLRLQVKYDDGKKNVSFAQDVQVWLFLKDVDAKKAKFELQENGMLNNRARYQSVGTTNNQGFVDLMTVGGVTNGYVLIDAQNFGLEQFAILMTLKELKPKQEAESQTYTMQYVIKDDSKRLFDNDVLATAQASPSTSTSMDAILNGRDVSFEVKAWIDSVHARRDARFVLAPSLVVPAEDFDTVGFFVPHVVDGADYERTMVRRMDGNLANDGLNLYKESEVLIFNRDRSSQVGVSNTMPHHKWGFFQYTQKILDIDTTKHYNAYAQEWFEDYKTIYHKDRKRLWDGNYSRINRFLDWKNVHAEIEIDSTLYAKEGKADETSFPENYHLEFENGKANLNMSDSTTVAEVERLKANIQRVYAASDGSYVTSVSVKGYASPEGRESGNRALSHNRAAYVGNLLRQFASSLPPASYEGQVVPWEEVADTLELRGDSLSLRAAAQIREICSTAKGLDAQYARIRQLPSYEPYIHKQILPCMRRVNIAYTTVTFKVRTQEEIYDLYQKDERYRQGTSQRGYEYYNLMNSLYANQDYEGLERIARQALTCPELKEQAKRDEIDSLWVDTVSRQEGNKTIYTYNRHYTTKRLGQFMRSYPLAGYYLAKSYLKRGHVDIHLLPEFIDYSRKGRPNEKRDVNHQFWGYWNDPAIVLAQIEMLCLDGRYNDARWMLADHFDANDPRTKRFSYFLRAMSDGYKEEDVRDTVAVSSPMNYLVAWFGYAKQTSDITGYQKAIWLIEENFDQIEEMPGYSDIRERWGDEKLDSNDPRVLYMKALCLFYSKLPKNLQDKNDAPLISSIYMDPDGDTPYAYPMLQACLKDDGNAKFLQTDGLVNDSYRTLVLFFYNRMKEGTTFEQARSEYDKLYTKYK